MVEPHDESFEPASRPVNIQRSYHMAGLNLDSVFRIVDGRHPFPMLLDRMVQDARGSAAGTPAQLRDLQLQAVGDPEEITLTHDTLRAALAYELRAEHGTGRRTLQDVLRSAERRKKPAARCPQRSSAAVPAADDVADAFYAQERAQWLRDRQAEREAQRVALQRSRHPDLVLLDRMREWMARPPPAELMQRR